jgi:hypothetical protein
LKRQRTAESPLGGPEGGSGSHSSLLVDGHVHFYDNYDETRFFDAALENLALGASQLECPNWVGCLVLTEGAGVRQFQRFARLGEGDPSGSWRFEPTTENVSLIARHDSGRRLILLSGRQIVTSEGLEVLVWATGEEIPDGLAVRDVLAMLFRLSVIAVIPWGFGKWWFARGGVLSDLLDAELAGRCYLADSGCRPLLSPYPRLLRRAKRESTPVLAGSDPLPLANEDRRAGSFGFELAGPPDWSAPAAFLVERVRELDGSPRLFGRYEGFLPFWQKQIAMQLVKRRRGRRE